VIHYLVELWLPVIAVVDLHVHKRLNVGYGRGVVSRLSLNRLRAAVSSLGSNQERPLLVIVFWRNLPHHLVHRLLVAQLKRPG